MLMLMLFTGPTATHALAKAALHGKLDPRRTDGDAQAGVQEEDGPSNT